MDERFIYLMEKYFSGGLTTDEEKEFKYVIQNDDVLKKEFEEQKNVQEVLNKMKIKNPLPEIWDKYWFGIYNRLERSIGWLFFSIGILIFLGYGSYSFVEKVLLKDLGTPFVIKIGAASLLFGAIVIIFSVVREKFTISKSDKYKEIQR